MNKYKDDPLRMLLNENLSEVDFVMDYLRLRFDTCFLTILTDPIVKTGFSSFPRSSPDFCNQILQFIGKKVERVYIKKDENLEIDFDNNFKIFVTLNPGDYKSAEALNLQDDKGNFWAW